MLFFCLLTQHESVLFSAKALNSRAKLPGMSRRRYVLRRLPSHLDGEYPDRRLGPDQIDLFVFQALFLSRIKSLPSNHSLATTFCPRNVNEGRLRADVRFVHLMIYPLLTVRIP
jgi:hypothetical protein